jgi:hypothetical protein
MKTIFKSLALALLVSSSCGFAINPDPGAVPSSSFAAEVAACLTPVNAVAGVIIIVAYEKLQEYVLAPYVKQLPYVGGTLETIRNFIDLKSNRNAGK